MPKKQCQIIYNLEMEIEMFKRQFDMHQCFQIVNIERDIFILQLS